MPRTMSMYVILVPVSCVAYATFNVKGLQYEGSKVEEFNYWRKDLQEFFEQRKQLGNLSEVDERQMDVQLRYGKLVMVHVFLFIPH